MSTQETTQEELVTSASVWLLSMQHVSKFTEQWLREENELQDHPGGMLRVLEWPNGKAIQVVIPEESLDPVHFPPDLYRLIWKATERGFSRIELDVDGPVYPFLTRRAWPRA